MWQMRFGFFVQTIPAEKTTSTRRQMVENALISGYLVFMDFHKTKQDKHAQCSQ